jgi:hypothetical protein
MEHVPEDLVRGGWRGGPVVFSFMVSAALVVFVVFVRGEVRSKRSKNSQKLLFWNEREPNKPLTLFEENGDRLSSTGLGLFDRTPGRFDRGDRRIHESCCFGTNVSQTSR